MRVTPRSCLVALLLAGGFAARADGGTIAGKVAVTPAKYLAETVVYLEKVPGTHPPRTLKMDQSGLQFVPHVLVVTVGDTVKFQNHDHVAHNVYSPDGEGYNLGSFGAGEERSQVFTAAGVFQQLCSVHPEMLGYVFVGQNPYAAEVDAQGHYALHDVPPGTYQLKVWNAHLPAVSRTVTVAAGAAVSADLEVHR